jgi:NTE family protein
VRATGASVGALVASLVIAGYKGLDIKDILFNLDFKSLLHGGYFGTKLFNLFFNKGIYSSINLEKLVAELLLAKGVKTFGDLKSEKFGVGQYPLRVLLSDVTNKRLVMFPTDAYLYGLNPDTLSVAWTVKASCSIPGFFRPARIGNTWFVDGGLLSNFPIWTFDSPTPKWPTFGLLLKESDENNTIGCLPHSYASAILSTALSAHDKMFLKPEEYTYRTIQIPVGRVKATDFNIDTSVKDTLYTSGWRATA